MGEGVNPPVLGGAPFPVGNNSMPPVASPRLGTSGCDYTGRIEFDKKPRALERLRADRRDDRVRTEPDDLQARERPAPPSARSVQQKFHP